MFRMPEVPVRTLVCIMYRMVQGAITVELYIWVTGICGRILVWNQTTHTFQETTSYEINLNDLHNNGENGINFNDSNTIKDDYSSYNNEGAQFKFYTTAGKGAVEVEKSYICKAGEDGLYIDGVMTKGVATGSPPQLPVEGNTTWEAMGITKNARYPVEPIPFTIMARKYLLMYRKVVKTPGKAF